MESESQTNPQHLTRQPLAQIGHTSATQLPSTPRPEIAPTYFTRSQRFANIPESIFSESVVVHKNISYGLQHNLERVLQNTI